MAFLRYVVFTVLLAVGIGSAFAESQPATPVQNYPVTYRYYQSGWPSNEAVSCSAAGQRLRDTHASNCGTEDNYYTHTCTVGGCSEYQSTANIAYTKTSTQKSNGTSFNTNDTWTVYKEAQCLNGGTPAGTYPNQYCNGGTIYTCPDSSWTLDGQTCTRPDTCQSGQSVSFSIFSGYSVGRDQVIGGTSNPYTNGTNRCSGGCSFNVASVSSCPAVVGTVDNPTAITCHGTGTLTGSTCTTDDTQAPTPPVVPNHRPKCLVGEGVLTSSSGTVACVPSGTPSSAPVVRTSSQTEQFPDGSTRTTETTYTKDPVSQVQDTQQQITNTPATGGGAGMAGPIGTTSNSGSATPSSGDGKESADFCRLNAQLQICKGDMNKEETQIKVMEYIKSLTDPANTAYTAIEDAKQTAESDSELKEQNDKFKAASEGTFTPDLESRNSWQSAMQSGWFEPVTRQGCSPYSATIGGRTWTLDICPTAEKISVISEYVIWFLLVVGVFVMLTGGTTTRQN